jgi:hypothetical protein
MLFDWLVTGQVMPLNPALSVRAVIALSIDDYFSQKNAGGSASEKRRQGE